MTRLRILHVIHDFLPAHRAGSEVYTFELARELAARHDVWVLCADCDPSRPHASLTWRLHEGLPVIELVNNWAFASFEETYRSSQLNASLRHVLHAVGPDVLHIHNLLNLSLDLPALARASGIPSVATLHDYTLLCPSGGQRVHAAESHVCEEIDTIRCSRCFTESPFHAQMTVARLAPGRALPLVGTAGRLIRRHAPGLFGWLQATARRTPGPQAGAVEFDRRLEQARRVFDHIDLFVAPSAALAREFVRFGLPADRLLACDNGMRTFRAAERQPRGDRLRVGFVGTLVWHKGAHVLLDAASRLPDGRFEVRLFGDAGAFPAYARTLRERAQGLPVRFMGTFDASGMPAVYAGLDVLVVPSLWPENSPLVIHEAFQAGVPVVAARMGGVPELVTHETNGLLYDAFSAEALASALRRLIDEPETLSRLARAVPRVRTIEEDASDWERRYAEVRARRHARGSALPVVS